MNVKSYVVVFPNIFSQNKIPLLIKNIKKILKIQKQEFTSIKRDGNVILVDANDPVFASSAINLLFGIEKIAIARQIRNNFQEITSEITSVGGNLLLKGEKFLVKVEGVSKGFLTKDVDIAATSNIIEKKMNLGVQPGTEENHDKLLYTYLTTNNAYVCIFIDQGKNGIPHQKNNKKTICALYDELSAISCYETIKQGHDVKIIICYRQKSDLTNIIKIINQIIPRLLEEVIELEFFQLKIKLNGIKNYLLYVNSVSEILLQYSNTQISLALSSFIFSPDFIDNSMKQVFQKGKIPIIPLRGVDNSLFEDAKEIGLKEIGEKLRRKISTNSDEIPNITKTETENILKTKQVISVKIGPNNIHDILDSLNENH
ncbi:MAG: thiamine biosynthesis protein [Nitrosopumilus sp.]